MDNAENISAPLPPLRRALEAVQFEHEGKPMVLLRDQEGITDNAIAVTLGGFLVATLLDGKNTMQDVQSIFSKTTGNLISPSDVNGLVQQLKQADLLEIPELQEKRNIVLHDFQVSTIRKPFFAGQTYPDQPMDLAVQLGKYFQDSKGPQKQLPSTPSVTEPPLGLFSPHIDFQRGGPAYAWAYQALADCAPPDLVVGLGVAHVSPNSPWIPSKKEYGTPYGPLKANAELAADFEKALWYEPYADEWSHRMEHSLEFQALWLKYIWRDKSPEWLPILCSSFYSFAPDRAPSKIETIEAALQKFGAILKDRRAKGQKIMILAGVDLAHVGPRFGDQLELTPEIRSKVEAEDKMSLDLALKKDADGFYMSVVADDHWRKVCGLSAIYTALRLIKIMAPDNKKDGKLLTYGQADDPMGGVVSFTSVLYPS